MSSIGKITGTVCRLTHNDGIKRLSLINHHLLYIRPIMGICRLKCLIIGCGQHWKKSCNSFLGKIFHQKNIMIMFQAYLTSLEPAILKTNNL
ncbi:hypothetical protein BARVI_11835 [Barnesiella viscericola DSM 18177]|uniref:Uncharacterized protein n=1 Tax=Barnesiella viscericola DSM 18177 TaxID=880074 RepID=W0ET58_9BACT|nr:hypothetical protein BARVI_11835 [Barnesiella viscericola DSM 18177]